MNEIYFNLALCGVLTVLLWTPYILARVFVWGLPTFLNNYPKDFPIENPQQPLWAERAQRAHLNMVETMPAFIAVVLGATQLGNATVEVITTISIWSSIFLYARLSHAIVYISGIPFLRTPTYLVSWFSILMIAFQILI